MHTTTNIFENSSYNKMCKRWSDCGYWCIGLTIV